MEKSSIRKSIAKAIKLLAADCNQEIKDIENMIEAWHITLEKLTDQQIWNGLKKALDRKDKFMVGSGEFKELALTGEGHTGIDSEAKEAWSLVVKNLNRYINPVFKNGVISEAIRSMGGWKSICDMLVSEQPFRERDFIEHYKTYKLRMAEYHQNVSRITDDSNLVFLGFNESDDIEKIISGITESQEIENNVFKMISQG